MRLFFLTGCLLATGCLFSQRPERLQPAQIKEDFAYLRGYLERTHPMLYLHHTKAGAQQTLDSLSATLNESHALLEFYRTVAFTMAWVGCEHSSAGYGPGFDRLLKKAPLLPYQLYISGGNVQVAVNMTSNRSIRPGDELVSINGYPIDSIRRVLHAFVPADGYIETSKDQFLSSMAFSIWYYLFVEQATVYHLQFKTSAGVVKQTVKAVSLDKLNRLAQKNPINRPVFQLAADLKEWRREPLRVTMVPEQRAAVLSVQTFSVEQQTFRRSLDSLFGLVKQGNVERLIIELQNNGGGDVELAADLLSYFIKAPTSLVAYSYLLTDRMEDLRKSNIPADVLDSVSKYIEPLNAEGRALVRLTELSGELKPLTPRSDRFSGQVFLYVNGGTSSAASSFAAVMKGLGLATIVGEETAGTYAGGGTVIGLDLVLPHSGITIHSGLVYQRHRTEGGLAHRGVMPDQPWTVGIDRLLRDSFPWRSFILEQVPAK